MFVFFYFLSFASEIQVDIHSSYQISNQLHYLLALAVSCFYYSAGYVNDYLYIQQVVKRLVSTESRKKMISSPGYAWATGFLTKKRYQIYCANISREKWVEKDTRSQKGVGYQLYKQITGIVLLLLMIFYFIRKRSWRTKNYHFVCVVDSWTESSPWLFPTNNSTHLMNTGYGKEKPALKLFSS